ncbi:hypothetical protein GCM10010399_67250 [Dactylosporangium fulvum]
MAIAESHSAVPRISTFGVVPGPLRATSGIDPIPSEVPAPEPTSWLMLRERLSRANTKPGRSTFMSGVQLTCAVSA